MPNGSPWNLERYKQIAIAKEGLCIQLINGKENSSGRYLFECKNKHQWEATGSNIGNGSWCRQCKKLSIQDCINEAEKRGGKCLDSEYKNRRTHINWECKNGHTFKLTMGSVRNFNRWCRKCFHDGMRHDISVAHELAEKNGGKCLSTEYVNLESPLKWRCSEGHEWEVAMMGIKASDQWCRMCHMRSRRDNALDKLEKLINLLNGKLVTKRENIPYDINSNTIPITATCSQGHTWTRELQTFFTGTWCPNCRFKSEIKCREIFEETFGSPFPKKRLAYMERLELDGYSEDFNIAFEYDGLQHEEYVPFFHREGLVDFWKQQERDERKLRLCEENGIMLIRIPSKYNYTRPEEMDEYIQGELEKIGEED
jgi:hypothetical protein